MKLLLHVDNFENWNMVIGNALNTKALKENVEIEIVANGLAAIMLKKSIAENFGLYNKFQLLNEKSIKIKICKNSMKKFDLKKEELVEFVIAVDAAILEILELQENGFSYVKP